MPDEPVTASTTPTSAPDRRGPSRRGSGRRGLGAPDGVPATRPVPSPAAPGTSAAVARASGAVAGASPSGGAARAVPRGGAPGLGDDVAPLLQLPRPDSGPATGAAVGPRRRVTDTSTGVAPERLGLLAYLFGGVGGLVLLLVERDHERVRFHAAQSLVLGVVLLGAWALLRLLVVVPVLGPLVAPVGVVVAVAVFVLWVVLLVEGHRLGDVRLPLVAAVADQVADLLRP